MSASLLLLCAVGGGVGWEHPNSTKQTFFTDDFCAFCKPAPTHTHPHTHTHGRGGLASVCWVLLSTLGFDHPSNRGRRRIGRLKKEKPAGKMQCHQQRYQCSSVVYTASSTAAAAPTGVDPRRAYNLSCDIICMIGCQQLDDDGIRSTK